MFRSRRSRKTRKTRKQKSRRGGAPTPIRDLISVAAYNDMPTDFRPSSAYDLPSSLRDIFSLALMQNLRRDDPTYNPLENEELLDDSFKIERIRGAEVAELFTGTMTDLDDNKIRNFLVDLQPGDRLKLTIV
jgi:hypothetical protein